MRSPSSSGFPSSSPRMRSSPAIPGTGVRWCTPTPASARCSRTSEVRTRASIRALAEGLADDTPEACAAARDLGVTHVLDFGGRYIFDEDPRAEMYPGLSELDGGPGLSLVASDGKIGLYEVDCD